MKYRPSIFDNIKHCNLLEDDQKIKRFLEIVEEFSNSFIDQDEDIDEK